MSETVDYKKLKLKAGLEIHQQIDTKHKLFCKCSTEMDAKESGAEVSRTQHPVASELGETDVATQFEALRNRSFGYQLSSGESCLVELDEEPPHDLNAEALKIALEIALLLNCKIPNEINVMRKTVTDGSNTSAFQRTAVIGMNGYLKHGSRKVEIPQVCLEEDASAIVGEENGKATFRLSRLGVPLVEITTGVLDNCTPKEVQEIAFMIGIICRSTGKVKHGIGSIRQDVNVSVKNGARVEIKGVQDLGLISKVVEKEVERQLSLGKVVHETRSAKPDGSTTFSRPLPGSARMYPETDVLPIHVDKVWIKKLKDELPEPWTNKLDRFKKKMKLSDDLAIQILGSDYMPIFENVMKKYPRLNATVVASVFTSTMKEMRRRKVDVTKIEEKHFMAIFCELSKKAIVKEAVPELLENFSKYPDEPMSDSVKKLNLTILDSKDLKAIISKLVEDSPDTPSERIYGIAMSRVRGRADPQDVLSILKSKKKK